MENEKAALIAESSSPTGKRSEAQGDGSTAIAGSGNTINEASVILRFLSIIEEQSRTITRLQDELLRVRLQIGK